MGFKPINKNPYIFQHYEHQNAYFCLYVNDIIIAAAIILIIKALKELLWKQYNIKNLKELCFFLGIYIIYD